MTLQRVLLGSLAACALIATTGCAQRMSTTPTSVSVYARPAQADQAPKLGEKECQKYGKSAKRQENLPKYLENYYVYDCVKQG